MGPDWTSSLGAQAAAAGFTAVDALLLAVLAVSVAVGAWRGFVFEAMLLAGWFVAWIAARMAGPEIAALLPPGPDGRVDTALHTGAGFALGFVAVLIGWGLLARGVRLLLRATPLSGPDRLLGAGFGAVRALLIGLLLAWGVGLTPLGDRPAWREARSVQWLGAMQAWLKPLWPAVGRDAAAAPEGGVARVQPRRRGDPATPPV